MPLTAVVILYYQTTAGLLACAIAPQKARPPERRARDAMSCRAEVRHRAMDGGSRRPGAGAEAGAATS